MQAADDHHHGEQEDEGAEVDEAQCFVCAYDAERHHEHRTDDGHSGTVDFEAGQLAQRKDHVADGEDDAGRGDLPVGERAGRNGEWCREKKSQTHVESV